LTKNLREHRYSVIFAIKTMEDNDGYVYFLADADYRYCKIGYSTEPTKRLARAQVDCPLSLFILHQVKGSKRLEKTLQMEMGPYWVRGE
jgi:T5orf172 domain